VDDGPAILLVEDEASIAEPFANRLRREGFAPTIARTAREALERAAAEPPALVVLDLNLPDGDGRDVARALRRDSEVPIIMLTARGSELDRVLGLELGADDYVVKPFSGPEVVARIRAVLRRTSVVPSPEPASGPLTVDGLELDPEARRVFLDGREVELTRREFDLLARLMRDAGKVVTREDLIADVWDRNWFGSTKTLDVHIAWLRRKLGDDHANPRFIHTVRRVGFRLAAEEDEDARQEP
jgi:DNA-binding response OmpR family regulator